MPDINLLPENLRQEEIKELNSHKQFAAATPIHTPNFPENSIKNQPEASLKKEEKAAVKPSVSPVLASEIKSLPKITAMPAPTGRSFWSKIFPKKTARKAPKPETVSRPPLKDIQAKPVQRINNELVLIKSVKSETPLGSIKSAMFDKEIDVNLIPEGSDLLPLKKIKKYLAITAAISLFLIGLGYLGINLYGRVLEKQLLAVNQQLESAEASYDKLKAKEQEATSWSNIVSAVSTLFKSHIYWSKFFQYLEKTTIPDVYYTSIGLSNTGVVTLTAQTINYTAVARQYKVFLNNQDIFPEVILGGFSGSNGAKEGIGFSVQLKLSPQLYNSLDK